MNNQPYPQYPVFPEPPAAQPYGQPFLAGQPVPGYGQTVIPPPAAQSYGQPFPAGQPVPGYGQPVMPPPAAQSGGQPFPAGQPAPGYGQPVIPPPAVQPYGQPFPAGQPAPGYGQPVYPPAAPVGYPPAYALHKGRDPHLKAATRTMNIMCLLVLLQVVFSLVAETVLLMIMMLVHVDVQNDAMAYQWLSTAMVPLSTALPFVIYLIIRRREVTDFLRFEKVGFLTALLCVLGGLGICLLGNYPAFFIQDFFSNFGYEPTANPFENTKTIPLFVLELLSTAVLVPVMEEFAFRGVLFSALRKFGTAFAVFGSALVFSLVHLDFSSVVFAFVAGLVFGYLYARTGNLWITIFIHMLNNGIAVVGSYSEFLFGEAAAEIIGSLTMIIPVALGMISLVLLALFRRDIFSFRSVQPRSEELPPVRGGKALSSLARSVVLWLVIGLMVFYTVTLFL